MVLTLEDLVRRRLPLLLVDPPGEALLRQLADLAGPVLGWSHKRRHDETQEVLRLVLAGSSRLLRTA
jgi:glycerol-3-phosphate dehydrogenase